MAVLPQASHEETLQAGERRKAIADHVFRIGYRELRGTIRVGVASFPSERVDSPNALIREADKALYRAKEQGRNRVA